MAFFIGQFLVFVASSLLLRPNRTRLALVTMSGITTFMVIYASYLTGGLANVTLAWFVASLWSLPSSPARKHPS